MGKIQRGLRISAIVEFFIAVVCTIILYLNKKQRINIQFLNIKEIALLAITLCLLVIIEEIILFVFAGVKIVKKGYHNVNYCDDELFAEIDKYTYCYKESNLYYINLIRIINLYYREGGPIDKLEKENQLEKLLLRNDFLHKQKNLFEDVINLFIYVFFIIIRYYKFNSFAISIIVALLGEELTDGSGLVKLVAMIFIIGSFFVIVFAKYVYRGQGGICLNQVYEYEISKLEEKISKLENKLIISNDNEKYIYTQYVALKELVSKKNKDRKYKKNKAILEDIDELSKIDLCMEKAENIYDRKLYVNEKEIYLAYKKNNEECMEETLANEEFEKLYKILSKYKMIDEKKFLIEESTQKMEKK